MRIGLDVHVLSGPAQGTATVWRALLSGLPPQHEYVLYSFDSAATQREYPQPWFLHRTLEVKQPHVRIQLLYPWIARRDRCDVFHANYYGPLLGSRGLVLTFHDVLYLDFPEFAPFLRRLQFSTLGRASAHAAKALLTDSQYAKERLVYHFGVDPDKVTVAYPGLDPAWLRPNEAELEREWSQLRDRLPRRFLIGVGRMDPRKNVVLSARIARQMRDEGLVDALVWIGPDDFGAVGIREELERERLSDVVIRLSDLTGAQLRAVIRHAKAMLFLSLAEGFGYPPLEAMALGTAAVVSNRTSIPEVCGDAALVTDPDDWRDVVQATRAVLTSEQLRDTLEERGRARLRHFTVDAMVGSTMAAYQRAADV